MRRLFAFRHGKYAITPLVVGLLVVVANVKSLSAQAEPTVANQNVMAVSELPTLKFNTFPCWMIGLLTGCCWGTGSFDFTLFAQSGDQNYRNVRVRLDSDAVDSKTITSNFSLDQLSFWAGLDRDDLERVDLERRSLGPKNTPGAFDFINQTTITTKIAALSPGEYKGTLRFTADIESKGIDTQANAAEGKAAEGIVAEGRVVEASLPLVIQVRHHWLLPAMVIFLGSAVGWGSSKYVNGARNARVLSRQVKELRDSADSLVLPSTPRAGWEFPSEAESLGYTRVLVTLRRIDMLAEKVLPVLFHEDEFKKDLQNTALRLSALKTMQDTRLQVQPLADDRWAAQLAIGGLLRKATDLLDRPTFGDVDEPTLIMLLDEIKRWSADKSKSYELYKSALSERHNRSELHQLPNEYKQKLLNEYNQELPILDDIQKTSDVDTLKTYDDQIAKYELVWRDHTRPWAKDCFENGSNVLPPVDDLFDAVDQHFWDDLKKMANEGKLTVECNVLKPKTYDLVELYLKPSQNGIDASRIQDHPLRVRWDIFQVPDDQKSVPDDQKTLLRAIETDGLALVQYFPSAGSFEVQVTLRWAGQTHKISRPCKLNVVKNLEYEDLFCKDLKPELAAIAAATLFAIVTGLSSQYDSTFGTRPLFLRLFLWAGGAGLGGNLFSQLGSTSSPGGDAAAKLK
ncbi:MAG: hypothetical protein ACK52U_13925 [Synechococcaceae cyanobacterium]